MDLTKIYVVLDYFLKVLKKILNKIMPGFETYTAPEEETTESGGLVVNTDD